MPARLQVDAARFRQAGAERREGSCPSFAASRSGGKDVSHSLVVRPQYAVLDMTESEGHDRDFEWTGFDRRRHAAGQVVRQGARRRQRGAGQRRIAGRCAGGRACFRAASGPSVIRIRCSSPRKHLPYTTCPLPSGAGFFFEQWLSNWGRTLTKPVTAGA